MTHLFLGSFDLADGGGELRRLILELASLVPKSMGAVPLATWMSAALTCHSAFFSRACLAQGRPERRQRRVPLEQAGPMASHRRRGTVAGSLERSRTIEREQVRSRQQGQGQQIPRPPRGSPSGRAGGVPAS